MTLKITLTSVPEHVDNLTNRITMKTMNRLVLVSNQTHKTLGKRCRILIYATNYPPLKTERSLRSSMSHIQVGTTLIDDMFKMNGRPNTYIDTS